ncbi:MAG: hypothetical protein ACJ8HI_21735 [Massilia sp.]|jgi:hypothetical protein
MRFECSGWQRRCYLREKVLKFDVFDRCFDRLGPGGHPVSTGRSFSDIDAITEIEGRGLIVEWKPAPLDINDRDWKGQVIMFKKLTRNGMLTVFVVAGDPEDMSVTHRGTFSLGRWGGWKPSSLEDLQEVVHEWVLWAQNNPFI